LLNLGDGDFVRATHKVTVPSVRCPHKGDRATSKPLFLAPSKDLIFPSWARQFIRHRNCI